VVRVVWVANSEVVGVGVVVQEALEWAPEEVLGFVQQAVLEVAKALASAELG